MADFQIKLTGLEPLLAKMRALPVRLRQKPARSALGKAAKVIRLQAKANALRINDPATGRVIADNIVQRVRSRYNSRTGDVMISVGVASERGRIPKGNPDTGPGGNTPHWHLVELGTQVAKAEPFLRPAAEEKAGQAVQIFITEMGKALDKLAAAK